jgi:hypothetical protein
MYIKPECVPCLLNRVLFQAKLADNGTELRALNAAMGAFSDGLHENVNSAKMATDVHRAAYRAMNVDDPYTELKIRADEVAEEYMGDAEAYISSSGDRMRAAILVSAVGNIMDFGLKNAIDDPDEFRREFRRMLDQGIGHDETGKVKGLLSKAGTVIYIFDNCGESQLDKLLIREIRRNGTRVVGVVRGKPILNDVTTEDAERISLDKEVDAMYTTAEFRVGVDLGALDRGLKNEIASADLIIAKGMANFESLSDQDVPVPVAHILRSKCAPIAEALGVPVGVNVVAVRESSRKKVLS